MPSPEYTPEFPRINPTWDIGEELSFATIAEFVAFEDSMPAFLDASDFVAEAWETRPSIKNHMKPKNYIGGLGNLVLVSIDDPVPAILNAGQSILSIKGGSCGGKPLADFKDPTDDIPRKALGFTYAIEGRSTVEDNIFSGVLVYATAIVNKRVRNSLDGTPFGLRRFLTKPKVTLIEKEQGSNDGEDVVPQHVINHRLTNTKNVPYFRFDGFNA